MFNVSKMIVTFVMVSVLLIAFVTGCETEEEPDEEVALEQDGFVLGSGPMGSGWYPINMTQGEIWMDELPVTISVVEGDAYGNIRMPARSEELDMGMTFTACFMESQEGIGFFEEDGALDGVKAMTSLYPAFYTIGVLDDSGVEEIEDLVGKDLYVGPPEGIGEQAFRLVLEQHDITFEDIEEAGGSISHGGYDDGATMLRDGVVDAMAGSLGTYEVISLMEIDAMTSVDLVSIPEETVNALVDLELGYAPGEIPAGVYSGQDEDVNTFSLFAVLVIDEEISEDDVYALTKTFWENLDRLQEEHPERGEFFDVENAMQGVPEDQFHPGALRYFEEVGIVD